MATTPEGEVKKIVRELLLHYDIQSASKAGAFTTAAGWYFMPVPWGVRGIPDFIGHYHGKFFAVETKAPGKKPTGFQLLQIEALRCSGVEVFVVDGQVSLNAFRIWLEKNKDGVTCYAPAFVTIEEYEEITGFKVNEAFRIGWNTARTTNRLRSELSNSA